MLPCFLYLLGGPSVHAYDFETAWVIAEMPDPGAAVGLSATIGFGTGHYYSGNRNLGATFLAVEGLGLVGTAIGTGLIADGDVDSGQSLWYAGLGLFTLGRLLDIGMAPKSAVDARRAMAEEYRAKSEAYEAESRAKQAEIARLELVAAERAAAEAARAAEELANEADEAGVGREVEPSELNDEAEPGLP